MTAADVANPFASDAAALRYHRGRPYHHERTLRRAWAVAAPPPGPVLDVACGTGLSTRALRAMGLPAVGADASPPMLRVARDVAGVPCARASAEALPVADRRCAVVTVSSALHWFDQPAFYAEARRVLRPDGLLVLYEHTFLGELEGRPDFDAWLRRTYLDRYPSPPRHARVGQVSGHPGFDEVGHDEFTENVGFDADQLVAYLLTQSNTIVPVEAGRESLAEARAWLLRETAAFFPDPSAAQGFRFWGRVDVMRPA